MDERLLASAKTLPVFNKLVNRNKLANSTIYCITQFVFTETTCIVLVVFRRPRCILSSLKTTQFNCIISNISIEKINAREVSFLIVFIIVIIRKISRPLGIDVNINNDLVRFVHFR